MRITIKRTSCLRGRRNFGLDRRQVNLSRICRISCFYESSSRHRKHREAIYFHLNLLLCFYVAIQFLYVDIRSLYVLNVNGFFALGFYTFREREVVGLHFSSVLYAELLLQVVAEVLDGDLNRAFRRLILGLFAIFILQNKGNITQICVVLRMLDLRLCLIHGLEIRGIHLIIVDLAYAQAGIIRHRIRILEGGRHLDALSEGDVDGLPVFLFLELLLVLFLRNLGLGRKLRLLLEELGRLCLFDFDRRTRAFANAYTAGSDHCASASVRAMDSICLTLFCTGSISGIRLTLFGHCAVGSVRLRLFCRCAVGSICLRLFGHCTVGNICLRLFRRCAVGSVRLRLFRRCATGRLGLVRCALLACHITAGACIGRSVGGAVGIYGIGHGLSGIILFR